MARGALLILFVRTDGLEGVIPVVNGKANYERTSIDFGYLPVRVPYSANDFMSRLSVLGNGQQTENRVAGFASWKQELDSNGSTVLS
jgi:hypothetical protein